MSIYTYLEPGRHRLNSPIVGTRAHELKEIREFVQKQLILKAFEKALHGADENGNKQKAYDLYLIPYAKKKEADQLASALFNQYLAPYAPTGINANNAVDWTPHCYWNCRFGGASPGQAITKSQDVRAGIHDWHIHTAVDEDGGVRGEYYLPPHIIALHEIQHVEEKIAGETAEEYMRKQAQN